MERSSGFTSTAIRMIGYLLAVLLVLALPLSILSNNTLRILLSPEDISEPIVSLILLRGGVRDQLTDTLISGVWTEGIAGGEAEALNHLTAQDRLKITQILFPKDWIRDQVRENLDILISWFETEEQLPRLTLNMASFQENLGKGGSNRIVEILVESWPQCSIQQERQLERILQQDAAVRFEFCRPGDELFQRIVDHVDLRIQDYIMNAPGDVPLFDELIPEKNAHALEAFRQNMLRLMLILNIFKPLPFLFMGLVMILVIRSWSALGSWWGIPLGIGALLALFLILLGHAFGPGALEDSMSQTEQIPELQEPIVNALWNLLAKILNQSAFQAFFPGIVGFVMFLLPRRSKRKSSEAPPSPVGQDTVTKSVEEIPPVEPFDPDNLESMRKKDPP